MNRRTLDRLTGSLIGPIPTAGHSLGKGALAGTVAFLIFEFGSMLNQNVPRVPVSWLMMVGTIAVEGVLLFRLLQLLRLPRRPAFLFLARLSYAQRIEVALHAAKRAQTSFFPFMGGAIAVAALLEVTVLKERSLMTLLAVPGASMLFMLGTAALCRFAIGHRWIAVSRRDAADYPGGVSTTTFFRTALSRCTVAVSRSVSRRLAPRGIRIFMMRNLLYLLRGEAVLTVLIALAAPAILAVLLLMIGDPASPFVSFLPLLAVFMMNLHLITELGEATALISECYWYVATPEKVLAGNFSTLVVPSLSIPVVYIMVTFPALLTLSGGVRLVNVLIAFAVTIAIGAFRASSVNRRDQDAFTDLLLFAGIAIGNFVPWVGGVLALVVLGLLVVMNWEMVRGGKNQR